jgi:hypothetical protein
VQGGVRTDIYYMPPKGPEASGTPVMGHRTLRKVGNKLYMPMDLMSESGEMER